jgi:hypothetical protein
MTHYTDPAEAARAVAARREDLDSWRQTHPDAEVPASVAQILDDQARNRSQLDRPFAAAWALLSAGYRVLPCNASGHPWAGAEPIGTTAQLMEAWDWWPNAIAGAACGREFDLIAAALSEEGMEWLAAAAVDPPTRKRPPAAGPEPTSVPFGGYREPGDPRPGPPAREIFGVAVRLVEGTAHRPGRAAATTAPGERGQSWGQDLADKLKRPAALTSTILCWAWPQGEGAKEWDLPIGRRVRSGVELLACVPADGAVLTVDGAPMRVSWGAGLARRQPMPAWLASEFGKLRAP